LSRSQDVLADALRNAEIVLVVRSGHEVESTALAAQLHLAHSREDVLGLDSNVLNSAPLVVLQVGLDLRLARSSKSGLVDGHEDVLVVVGQHHGVEARVQCSDILSSELAELVESSHATNVINGLEELGDVADNVVDAVQTNRMGLLHSNGLVARQVRASEVSGNPTKDDIGLSTVHLDLGNGHLLAGGLVHQLGGCQHADTSIGKAAFPGVLRTSHTDTDGSDSNTVIQNEPVHFLVGIARMRLSRSSAINAHRVRSTESEKNLLGGHSV